MSVERAARLVQVRGVVQGVGFRPFVYGLATDLGLFGWVRNTSWGVEIVVAGSPAQLDAFRNRLEQEAPPRAHIESVHVRETALDSPGPFAILESHPEPGAYQLVSPDIATCPDCLRELSDPADRRYRYPFINCTNCGPRFTIIRDIPYDRPLTTMSAFAMCPRCRAEYDDPRNRRFHAQPNACPACGPHLSLLDRDGAVLAKGEEALQQARAALAEGRIVAVKGLGGFQLACDATNAATVAELRRRKARPHKPFAVMVADLDAARRLAAISPEEEMLLSAPERPIVLLAALPSPLAGEKGEHSAMRPLAPNVSPGIDTLGVMLPYTPLHHLLLQPAPGFPPVLIMTSGNLSEEPIAMENAEALAHLGGIADLFLMHNRGIAARYDDSVWAVAAGRPQAVRRARGYAPSPVRLPFCGPQSLACGAELKNTFCYTRDEYAFLSPHVGDLENAETLDHFERSLELYQKLFRLQPQVVAYDLHPDYLASKWALARYGADSSVALLGVQHHHAHIAACLADNAHIGPALGIALDGTGYGADGHIWGGEFLLADLGQYRRLGWLAEFRLPGGDAAARRTWRAAVALALAAGLDPDAFPALARQRDDEKALVRWQCETGLNSPLTSSTGRLFDAIAALLGIRSEVSFEAQAAMEMEALAARAGEQETGYPMEIVETAAGHLLDWRPLLLALLADVQANVPAAICAARFHVGLGGAVASLARRLAEQNGLRTVALSGGCFQNRLLLAQVISDLEDAGLQVLWHQHVPCNDGGLSLGQAAVAAWKERSR